MESSANNFYPLYKGDLGRFGYSLTCTMPPNPSNIPPLKWRITLQTSNGQAMEMLGRDLQTLNSYPAPFDIYDIQAKADEAC